MSDKLDRSMDLLERFWAKVDRSATGSCWRWTAALDRKGYGRFGFGHPHRHTVFAHRLAFMLTKGDPGDLCVCHSCDTPACCNPDHLFLGTITDNNRDMWRKGRGKRWCPTPEQVSRALLTWDAVRAIRRRHASGEERRTLALAFGVTTTTIGHIVHHQTWREPQEIINV